ncbi:type 1 glutamine amidotransferase [Hansschlegelia beijingensis]|uniref:GMP synthase-like glutamine amidotransferase n=1 Tax=Hansschlegelia beijingensis TaxID=1133344 RepID=A0A7W6GFP8_9HYPH|nr:type 1 glutamine amidotransferase [Hansschlegelia beijingensis]MBB3973187.1 GMP synthase-like glutamine amidotransferase [Hansschlegelia beijingensis]
MRILVLQHLDVEHPGSLREVWARKGHERVTVELDAGEPIPELEGFDMLAVMGGPMDVWEEDAHPWLRAEKAAIRRWVRELGRPYLGVCLGHQLLAEALGGRVAAMAAPEVGVSRIELTEAGRADPLFAGFGSEIEVFQWHGCEVSELPEGAVSLARSRASAVQAMRWGRCAYGLQFHPEIVEDTVADWKRIPEYWASLVKTLGPEGAEDLAGVVTPRLPSFRATAQRLDDNLCAALVETA